MQRRILMLVLVLATGLVGLSAGAVTLGGSCADDSAYPGGAHPGGEWRSYGHDLANTRSQPDETIINASNVSNIKKSWSFDASVVQAGGGSFSSTPVVADGCVFAASSTGFVFAMNADTGTPVWKSIRLPGVAAGSLTGGVITGSPVVANGKVYVAVAKQYAGPATPSDPNGPFVAILNETSGDVIALAPVMDPAKAAVDYRTNAIASPAVFDGMIFQGIMADEASAGARGGYAILDAATGALIDQEWTISDAEYAAGYRGASMWCSPAVDAATGYVYSCGGNPASKQLEARNSNALVKIDLRCDASPKTLSTCRAGNPTFGRIVDAYKGEEDHYYPGLDRQPACDQVPTTVVWSPTCVQMDLDFGASPNLFRVNIGGEDVTLVGDLQKSGIYHAAFADTMQGAWTAMVGGPAFAFNATSPAVDGTQVYTTAQPPGQMWALSKDRGRYRWVAPLADATHYQSVSVANGVVYSLDDAGTLYAIDAATGLIMMRHPLSLDVGGFAGDLSSQGIAIARNTVYAASASFIVAYN